jgi:hypothetical protein
MNLKKFIIDWPWTQTTKAVFLLLAVAAVVVGLVNSSAQASGSGSPG